MCFTIKVFAEKTIISADQKRLSHYQQLHKEFYALHPLPFKNKILGDYGGRCSFLSQQNMIWASGLHIGKGPIPDGRRYPQAGVYWAHKFELGGGIFRTRVPGPVNYFDLDTRTSEKQAQLMSILYSDFDEGNIFEVEYNEATTRFRNNGPTFYRYNPKNGEVLTQRYIYEGRNGENNAPTDFEFCRYFSK